MNLQTKCNLAILKHWKGDRKMNHTLIDICWNAALWDFRNTLITFPELTKRKLALIRYRAKEISLKELNDAF